MLLRRKKSADSVRRVYGEAEATSDRKSVDQQKIAALELAVGVRRVGSTPGHKRRPHRGSLPDCGLTIAGRATRQRRPKRSARWTDTLVRMTRPLIAPLVMVFEFLIRF